MSTIQKWVDLEAMPHLKNTERMIAVLFSLGAATRKQLSLITGWSELKVRDTIQAIRNLEPIPPSIQKQKDILKEAKKKFKQGELTQTEYDKVELPILKQLEKLDTRRDQWVTIVKSKPSDPSSYTLGRLGADYAKEIREEYRSTRDDAKRQLFHYQGTNDILCRIRQKGVMETDWLSSREIGQSIYYYWQRHLYHEAKKKRQNTIEKTHIPYKPDAYLQLDEDKYLLEFDTGSESNERLRIRSFNCLRLYLKIHDPKQTRLPKEIVWVTTSQSRKKMIEKIAKEALEDFQEDQVNKPFRVPQSYCFVAGEETPFLLGHVEAKPFWYGGIYNKESNEDINKREPT